jgi:hypothetical protein
VAMEQAHYKHTDLLIWISTMTAAAWFGTC